ncbi:MAG: serine/threonine-protein kinase, partial [Candidatus Humimicrobiia bacterium]
MPNQLPRFCIRCGEKIEDYSDKTLCNKCIKELKLSDTLPDSKTIPQKEKPIKKFPKNDVEKITIPIDKRELKAKKKIVPKIWNKGDIILDLYEVRDELGVGGMGKVHKVYHRGWNIDLAVKSPNEDSLSRAGGIDEFINEAETWINLDLHPNIVTCYYTRTLGNIPRIFIEFVDEGSLKKWIKEGKLTELKDMLDVAIQFAWGLNYSHKQQIRKDEKLVHKDVKPANVLMTKDGTLKITDFGLSKARGGMTPEYCSPEQV